MAKRVLKWYSNKISVETLRHSFWKPLVEPKDSDWNSHLDPVYTNLGKSPTSFQSFIKWCLLCIPDVLVSGACGGQTLLVTYFAQRPSGVLLVARWPALGQKLDWLKSTKLIPFPLTMCSLPSASLAAQVSMWLGSRQWITKEKSGCFWGIFSSLT